jgi:hypothetical protein
MRARLFIALALVSSLAQAKPKPKPALLPPPPPPTAARPWAEGVSPEQQTEALKIFDDGNALFAESQHAAALARYREALKVWDHPAIRYNAAVALINLDQPLAADVEVDAAMRFGEPALGGEIYRQALLYKKLLGGQLADLDIACSEPGAEVMLDGQLLFVAPGQKSERMLPGPHSLVARKAGYLTETRALMLPPGRRSDEKIAMVSLASLPTRTVRRWKSWKPWALFGAGVLVALVGVPLMVDAKHNLDSFDADVARSCPNGCAPGMLPSTTLDAHSRAGAENGAAIGMFAAGGAVAAVGVVLLIMNQPHAEKRLALAPSLAPGLVGMTASLRFP